MEVISSIFEVIFSLIYNIIYFVLYFFFCTAVDSHLIKIAWVLIIAFLIHTTLRPEKWKWITLVCTEVLFFIGTFWYLGIGITEDSLGKIGYGIIAIVFAIALFFITLTCNLRKPSSKPKNETEDLPYI